MKLASDFLIALGQALAGMALYAPDHNMRIAARMRVYEAMLALVPVRGVVRLTFLHGDAIAGVEVLSVLRGWDWSRKLAAAGIQRIEIDAVPQPTNSDVERFLQALHKRLQSKDACPMASIVVPGLRAGTLALHDGEPEEGAIGEMNVDDSITHLPPPALIEESEAVRWIHNEVANSRAMPLAEVEGVVHGLAAAMHRDQHVLMPLLDLKSFDQYTTTHSCNVSMLSMGLAEQLGFAAADVRAVGTAALLHDIGKVHVPVEILVKPGKLTDEEMDYMRGHTSHGARMLGERGRGHALAAVVAYEHHVWANSAGGYPNFQFGRRCHYASRIVHVCDLYDALSTRRPYRDAWPRERTLGMLQDRSSIEVDADIVEAFQAMIVRCRESRTEVVDQPQNDWNAQVADVAEQLAGEAVPV